jgi:hypothetical protein
VHFRGARHKEKREAKDVKDVTMKNGKPAQEGVCPTCGTRMFRIGGGKTTTTTTEPEKAAAKAPAKGKGLTKARSATK